MQDIHQSLSGSTGFTETDNQLIASPLVTKTSSTYTSTFQIQEWILRIGICCTFLGHGLVAYSVKASWIPYLTTVGFSKTTACMLMPIIGISDLVVAFLVLLKPIRILLIWASIWAFSTALMRPLSGEQLLDFIERTANWSIPLALLAMHGFPTTWKALWSVK